MKRATLFLTLASTLAACNQHRQAEQHSSMNQWMVTTYQQDMTDAAIVAQRTVFPHHFAGQTDELNARGTRNLHALAKHFKDHPGTLNVRRSDTPAQLHEQRLTVVRDFLASHGVNTQSMTFADGFSGGDGITSDQWRQPATTDETPDDKPPTQE